MKKLAIILALGIGSIFVSYTQHSDTLLINKERIGLIQMLQPAFHYVENEELFTTLIHKYWAIPYVQYLENGGKKIQWSTEKKSFYMQMAELYFELNNSPKTAEELDEKEVKKYYEVNKSTFTNPYLYSFYQSWVPIQSLKDTVGVKQELKKRLNQFKSGEKNFDKIRIGESGLNFESELEISKNWDIFPLLNTGKELNVIGPLKLKHSYVYAVITEKKGGEIKPFEEVRQKCITEIQNKKQQQEQAKLQKKLEQILIIHSVNPHEK